MLLFLLVRFTWDHTKAAGNAKKHGVTFEEAATVFSNPLARIFPDSLHADRGLMLGHAEGGGLLVVVFSEVTEDVIRIISARPATSRERKHYEGDA